jgi:hypothetical protein
MGTRKLNQWLNMSRLQDNELVKTVITHKGSKKAIEG